MKAPPEHYGELGDCLEITWPFSRRIDEIGQSCGRIIEQVISK